MIIYASHTKILVRNSLDNTYDLIVQNLEKNIIHSVSTPIMRGVWDPMSFSYPIK